MDAVRCICTVVLVFLQTIVEVRATFPHHQPVYSGVHRCISSATRCCPGWQPRGARGACLSPVCSYGCLSGVCIGPNVCQCVDGRRSVTCPVVDQAHVPIVQNPEQFSHDDDNGLQSPPGGVQPPFTCESIICAQDCHMVDGIPQCSCIHGFSISDDGTSCEDVDECMTFPGICQQMCRNTAGSFMCACSHGYTLTDNGRTCRYLHDYRHSSCRSGKEQSCKDRTPHNKVPPCGNGACSGERSHVQDIKPKAVQNSNQDPNFLPEHIPIGPQFYPNQRHSIPCSPGECGTPVGQRFPFIKHQHSSVNDVRRPMFNPNLPQFPAGDIMSSFPGQGSDPFVPNREPISKFNSHLQPFHRTGAQDPKIMESHPQPPLCVENGCTPISEVEQNPGNDLPFAQPQPCSGRNCPPIDFGDGDPQGNLPFDENPPCDSINCAIVGDNYKLDLPPNVLSPCEGYDCQPIDSFNSRDNDLKTHLPSPCANENCQHNVDFPDGFTEWMNGAVGEDFQGGFRNLDNSFVRPAEDCLQTGCNPFPDKRHPRILSNLMRAGQSNYHNHNLRSNSNSQRRHVYPITRRIDRNYNTRNVISKPQNRGIHDEYHPPVPNKQLRGQGVSASLHYGVGSKKDNRLKSHSQNSAKRSKIGVENLFENVRHSKRHNHQQRKNDQQEMSVESRQTLSSGQNVNHKLNQHVDNRGNARGSSKHRVKQHNLKMKRADKRSHRRRKKKKTMERKVLSIFRTASKVRTRTPNGKKDASLRNEGNNIEMTTTRSDIKEPDMTTDPQYTKPMLQAFIKVKRLKNAARQNGSEGNQQKHLSGRIKQRTMAGKIENFLTYFNKLKTKRGKVTQQKIKNIMQSDGVTCRDDLCTEFRKSLSENEEIPSSFLCPPGFQYKIENNIKYCEPDLPMASKDSDKIPIPLHSDVICPPGQKAMKTPSGTICQYVEASTVKTPTPECKPGQRLQLSHTGEGYSCVNELVTHCGPGEEKIQTASGYVCKGQSSTTTTTELPCPVGLMPVQTPVGMICQYIPLQAPDRNKCQQGQIFVNTQSGFQCQYPQQPPTTVTPLLKCPNGLILVDTIDGTRCMVDPRISSKTPHCPEGSDLVRVGDSTECKPKWKPCPLGQSSVKTAQGLICQYDVTGGQDENERLSGGCIKGELLTQLRAGFFCQPSPVNLKEWFCPSGEVLVQLKTDLVCMAIEHTSVICMNGLEMVMGKFGFICINQTASRNVDREPGFICRDDEVLLQDDFGRRCMKMNENKDICGEGFKVIKSAHGMVCKPLVMDITCPHGFYLIENGEFPKCLPVTGLTNPKTPCLDDYHVANTDTGRKCVLTNGEHLCPDEGSSKQKGCVRSLKALILDCNPQCANGGTCQNGSCVCVKGITGVACQQDIDECRMLSRGYCQYGCENTFGSYRCTCPPGRTLNTDGRTCKEIQCIPECLNGGRCMNGRCRCTSGFEGALCQDDINECTKFKSLCQHHCRNTYGSYACVCPPGSRLRRDGRTCINTTCTPECKNDGVCHRNRCRCRPGYEGITCQIDVNECYPNPCSHNCSNIPGSYKCACPNGFVLGSDKHNCRKVSK